VADFAKPSKINVPDIFPKRPGPHQRSRQAIILRLAALFKARAMPNYRIVTVDQAGNLGRHRAFVSENDDDAIVWAKQLLDDAPVELWSGARFVTRLEPQSALSANARL
jgi:hypothetical protein